MYFPLKKRGIVPVVVISLLLLLSVILYIQFDDFFSIFKSDFENDLEEKDFYRTLEILSVDGTVISLKNEYKNDLNINSIKIDSQDCSLTGSTQIDKGLATIDIGSCSMGLTELQPYDVSVLTDFGVLNEVEILRNIVTIPLVISFQTTTCDISSGYVRLYGMSAFDNAHAEISSSSSYSFNVCVRHLDYTLGTTETGTFETLLYLLNSTNSEVFSNKSSVYETPELWNNITISTSAGIIGFEVNSTQPVGNYTCIGAIDEDNIYGSHIANCNSATITDKLWLSID